jgi:transposase
VRLYAAFDLHSSSSYLAVIDGKGKQLFKRKMHNDPDNMLETLEVFKKDIKGIAVESTYNWYWLVDTLMDEGYKVHLANPAAIQKYSGIKHSSDKHDAFWLAEMLRHGILPEGYIYPKKLRPARDLLRKRGHLVKLRTSLILSLQNIIARNCSFSVRTNDIKKLKEDIVTPLLEEDEDLFLSGTVSKHSIDFMTGQIRKIEKVVEKKVRLKKQYKNLLTMPGVGKIIALTIMLETGSIGRFNKVGNYASYCRKVSSKWTSNDKAKGKGNKKNGNRYLAWAYSEASQFARRYNDASRRYYNRKLNKTNAMVARSALSHKLTRAAYYIMRDQVPFKEEKLYRN